MSEPVIPKAADGIYPRCVYCLGEIPAVSVIAYSAGEVPCSTRTSCERYLPPEYVVEDEDPPFVFRAEEDGREWRSDYRT
jgi:hypothetical protein